MNENRGAPPAPNGVGVLEKHVQTILLSLITACLVGGAVAYIAGVREDAKVAEKIERLTAEVTAMRAEQSLMRVNFATAEQWRDHEARLRDNERAIYRLTNK